MTDGHIFLLSEGLRPRSLDEINLPKGVLDSLRRMEDKGSVMNLIFHGKPGIGKTSAARILSKNADVFELNGSFNNGDKTMVNDIKTFASYSSLFGQNKMILIDEADFMSKAVQDSLRYVIEEVSKNTRFLLTANDISRLTPAIRSRCLSICFDVAPKDKAEVIERMLDRYERRLTDLNVAWDRKRLEQIIAIYFPDLREIANRIQFEFVL